MYELSVLFCHVFLIFVFNYLWIKERREYRKFFYKKIARMVNSFVIAQWVILLIFFAANIVLILIRLMNLERNGFINSYDLLFTIKSIWYASDAPLYIEIIKFNNIIFSLSAIIYASATIHAADTYRSCNPSMCIFRYDENESKKELVITAKIGKGASNKALAMYAVSILKTILKRSKIDVDEKVLLADIENILKSHGQKSVD